MDCRSLSFTLATLGITMTSTSVGASCPTLTIDKNFAISTAVFVGRATDQKSTAAQNPGEWAIATETTFEVEDVWKGPRERTIRVKTCGGTVNGESVTCSESFRFMVGSKYLVFALGDPLQGNDCAPTAQVDLAGRTLQWLSDKPHTKLR
jgi:hypothetical protein